MDEKSRQTDLMRESFKSGVVARDAVLTAECGLAEARARLAETEARAAVLSAREVPTEVLTEVYRKQAQASGGNVDDIPREVPNDKLLEVYRKHLSQGDEFIESLRGSGAVQEKEMEARRMRLEAARAAMEEAQHKLETSERGFAAGVVRN